MTAAGPALVKEGAAPSAAGAALARREEEIGQQVINRAGYDIANLSDEDFDRGLERIKLRQSRMLRVINQLLRDGIHFGNPNDAFERPILMDPGASELRNFFRIECQLMEAPVRIIEADFCSVSVTVGAYDSAGRLLGTCMANCNTTEKRFKKRNGQGATFTDAREKLNDCEKMAFKRAANKITAQVTGADAFFVTEEELSKATGETAEDAAEKYGAEWTEAEKKQVYSLADRKGIATKKAFADLVDRVLGRAYIATGKDVEAIIAELNRMGDAKHVKPEPAKAASRSEFDDPPAALAEDPNLPF